MPRLTGMHKEPPSWSELPAAIMFWGGVVLLAAFTVFVLFSIFSRVFQIESYDHHYAKRICNY